MAKKSKRPGVTRPLRIISRRCRMDAGGANDKSGSAQIVGGAFARATVLNDVVGDLLAVIQRTQTCALNCGDVNENVRAAVVRLNEAEALGGVEPLYSTSVHNDFLS